MRAYQTDVKLFLDYATDPAYDWNEHCGRLFGTVFSQVITEFNRATHVQADDARALKRPFTPSGAATVLRPGRPGARTDPARRDARARWRRGGTRSRSRPSTAGAFAATRSGTCRLVDFSRNARAPFFGEWGLVRVRHGKAMRGSPAKQRTVLTVFDWAAEALADWVERGLPRYGQPVNDLFPTEKGGSGARTQSLAAHARPASTNSASRPGLDLHSFRRAYATNLQIEYGYDVSFVQLQLGHEHAATTSIYTLAAPDYRARELERVLSATLTRSNARPGRGRHDRSRNETRDPIPLAGTGHSWPGPA